MNPETHEVIAEPCEHCGADIEGWDYEAEYADISGSPLDTLVSSVPTSSQLKLIPCGHYMRPIQLTYLKREGESNGLRQP
jgi:hypothetical protein